MTQEDQSNQASRSTLKAGITSSAASDAPLEKELLEAKGRVELEKRKEDHAHERAMQTQELGWCGRFLGGGHSASMTIAVLAMVLGFVMIGATAIFEATCPKDSTVWLKIIDGGINIMISSIAYVFGRSSIK